MDKARKMKIVWLSLGVFSAVSAAVGAVLLAWLLLSGEYIWGAVAGAFTVHGFYGIPFYFSALWRTRVDLLIMDKVDSKLLSFAEISDSTGFTIEAVKSRLAVCLKRGYLVGYVLTNTGLKVAE